MVEDRPGLTPAQQWLRQTCGSTCASALEAYVVPNCRQNSFYCYTVISNIQQPLIRTSKPHALFADPALLLPMLPYMCQNLSANSWLFITNPPAHFQIISARYARYALTPASDARVGFAQPPSSIRWLWSFCRHRISDADASCCTSSSIV